MTHPDLPAVVFVYQGTAEQSSLFFEDLWPAATAVADPDGDLYRAFGVRRGGLRQMFGLDAWRSGVKAALQGHRIGRKIGDPWTLPTLVAVEGRRVVWRHDGRHAGDHVDVGEILEAVGGSG